jgi:archaellum component FlaC
MNNSIKYLSIGAIALTLTSCTESKQLVALQQQAAQLENTLKKEREENVELSSFRFSLESQFKKKTEDYVKCQEDGKETMESLSERYNRLLTDYNQLSASYEVLDKSNREQVEATKARISELESQYKSAASKKIVTKSKRKRRR